MNTRTRWLVLALILNWTFLILNCFAAAPSIPPPRPASQAEVDAGTVSNKWVSPLTLAGYSLGQSTGSISAATATNIAAYQALIATNKLNTDMPTRLNFPLTNNDTRNISFASSNFVVGTGGSNYVGSLGDYLTVGAGETGFTFDNQLDIIGLMGSSVFPGNNIQVGSLNSNRFDAATLAKLYESSGGTNSYSNDTGLPGVINGGNIGTNLASLVKSSGGYATNLTLRDPIYFANPTAGVYMNIFSASEWHIGDFAVSNYIVSAYTSSNLTFKGTADFTSATLGTATASGLVTMNASATVANGATSAGVLKLMEDSDDGSNFASFQVPALAANTVYTLPTTDGAASEFLQTDGSGTLTWATPSGSTALWFTNPVAASSISNAYNVKIDGDLSVTGTASVSTNNATNMVFVGRANAVMQIGSAGVLETNSVTTFPITGAGVAATSAQVNSLFPTSIATNGATPYWVNDDYTTNAAAVAAAPIPSFALGNAMISTNADFSFATTVAGWDGTKAQTTVLVVSNAAKGSLMTVTVPAVFKQQGTMNVTNNGVTVFTFYHYGAGWTNCRGTPLF